MTTPPNVHAAEPIPQRAHDEIMELLESGDLFRYTAPRDSAVARLEREFAEYLDVPFALAVNSCSSALFLSLKALGLGAGEHVLMPAFTFAAVPSSAVHAGCVPVLVNVGPNFRIDLEDFEEKLTGNVGAVIVSHMRGHTSDMDAIMQLCDARGLPVIEDAAHSFGATWAGKPIGTIGKIGCFSFQSYKLINAGEGGMLITRDADIIAQTVIMSGAYEKNWQKHPAVSERFPVWQNQLPLYNMRMNNLSAAVARSQIAEAARRIASGRANHDYVASILNRVPHFEVPEPLSREIRAPDSLQFNLRGVSVHADANAFVACARNKGVELQIFGLAEDNARAFWNWKFIPQQRDLGRTRKMLMRACDVRLPARLRREDLDYIANALVEAASETLGRWSTSPRSNLRA